MRKSSSTAKHRPQGYYQVTIRLIVTDEKALRSAADELAKCVESESWNDSRHNIRDDLIVLLDLGDVPCVKIVETLVDPVSPQCLTMPQ
jgi:hypothetical protein